MDTTQTTEGSMTKIVDITETAIPTGRYAVVEMPDHYDPAEVTEEDARQDGAIRCWTWGGIEAEVPADPWTEHDGIATGPRYQAAYAQTASMHLCDRHADAPPHYIPAVGPVTSARRQPCVACLAEASIERLRERLGATGGAA